MAVNFCYFRPSMVPPRSRTNTFRHGGFRCCSGESNYEKSESERTPQLVKFAVSGVTGLLRVFSPTSEYRLGTASNEQRNELLISGIDDVVMILKSDYENAYFVTGCKILETTDLTGMFTSAIYAEDCTFEDPTIKFRGKDLYARNLKLLVPFFEDPSIKLQKIEKGSTTESEFVLASWKLRTFLKLPWRPLISIEGSTVYDLDNQLRIVRHAESWSISALEAIGQIFTPSFGRTAE